KYIARILDIKGNTLVEKSGKAEAKTNQSIEIGKIEYKIPDDMKGRTVFVSVVLRDNNNREISYALYPIAVSKTGNPEDYFDIFEELNRMPQVPLKVSFKEPNIKFNSDGKGITTLNILNPSDKLAFFVGIKMVEESETLKSDYSDNYVAILPGESRDIIITITNEDQKTLPRQVSFEVAGWNSPAQGTQFLGLSLLPSVTVSLMLNFTPIVVAIMGIFLIDENPAAPQWFGAVIFLAGILIYFIPISVEGNSVPGLIIMSLGVLANSGSAILGRDINRNGKISPLVVTFISMGTGSIILIITGFITEGFPVLSTLAMLYLIWLIIVNTAFAFTIWNLTLRSINAVESSIINSTMLIQIAVLAYLFLGEEITFQKGFGMMVAALGVIFVQIKRKKFPKVAIQ
ncbi:MAG: EamA family transporter, partial [Ignavibacteriaceae bacterium]